MGFLHSANGRFEALACDLQEPFRPYVDRLVVRLLNLKVIEAQDFEQNEQGWWLNRVARDKFLQQFAREIDRRPARRVFSLREAIEGQVHSLFDWITQGRALQIHAWQPQDHV